MVNFEAKFNEMELVVNDAKQQFEALDKVVGSEINSAVKRGIKEVKNEMKMNNSSQNAGK